MTGITDHEAEQVEAANTSGRAPVVFVHGLWLLPNSWDRWRSLFEDAGYATVAPGWPDDPETVAEANAHPEVLAGKSIRDLRVAEVLRQDVVIENGQVSGFRVRLAISFKYESGD